MIIKPSIETTHKLFRPGTVVGALAFHMGKMGVGDEITIDKVVDGFDKEVSFHQVRVTIGRIVKKLGDVIFLSKIEGKQLILKRVS